MAAKQIAITSSAKPAQLTPEASIAALQEIDALKKEASLAKELGRDFLFMGLTMTLDISAQKLASKDKNVTGVDDAIAAEMAAFASKIRKFQLTGIWEAAPGL